MTIQTLTCCEPKCCEPIYMPAEKVLQYRVSGATFHCNKGHAQWFPPGPSPQQRLQEEVARLERRLASEKSRTNTLNQTINEMRHLLIQRADEPGIHPIGDSHYVWVCTCRRKGHGTFGKTNTKSLLAAHQKAMHCNPISGIEVKA